MSAASLFKIIFSLVFFLLVASCERAPPPFATPSAREPACRATYSEFFEKDALDFRIIFGYKDARPARYVGDRYERAYFIQKIIQYGFTRTPENENTFRFERMGLDGQLKRIRLQIVESSVGPDDEANRRDPFQPWKSDHAETLFLDGLKKADLVFYYGHSRDGGGPDFMPPLLDRHQHVNYAWYLRHHPGLKKMTAALRRSNRPHQILGMFSCVSDKLFARELLKANAHAHLIVSNVLLYYHDALDGMMESLRNVIEMKCEKDFHPPGTQLIHFFKSTGST